MDNLLRRVESDEVIVYADQVYSVDVLHKCREIHKKLAEERKLEGEFDAEKWMGYSGVKKFGIDFSFDIALYNKHIGREFGISVDTMKKMLRCYAIYCSGVYIYPTIARKKINVVKEFIQKYADRNFRLDFTGISTVEDFLGFIGTPEIKIEQVISTIKLIKNVETNQRKLSPIINYLVIEAEIDRIYNQECDDEIFLKWFPIYFWVKITFCLPLRATEMLVTPKDCIYRDAGEVYIRYRRTKLKKGARTVYYDVNKDYKEFSWKVPDGEVVKNIEKYIKMTDFQSRRFLFLHSDLALNNMLSLQSFNELIALFFRENIVGNNRYDFAKYAIGITEFQPVTAGDSRPIAMANIYFQKMGADICRQLADHTNISTSSGYYTNISETIWASSVVQLQKKFDAKKRYSDERYMKSSSAVIDIEKSICVSNKRAIDEENLDDCIEEGHLADCIGCKYYRPSQKELDSFLDEQKQRTDKSAKKVIELMNESLQLKNKDITLEEIFLQVQTDATRYRMGCNIKAEEKLVEWQRLKNIQKTNY